MGPVEIATAALQAYDHKEVWKRESPISVRRPLDDLGGICQSTWSPSGQMFAKIFAS
jgi:hypothetical protein